MKKKIFDILKCNFCDSSILDEKLNEIVCRNCNNSYTKRENKIYCVNNFINVADWKNLDKDKFYNTSPKQFLNKRYGPLIKDLVSKFNAKIAINLGSGDDNYDGYINLDLGNYKNVDLVSDLTSIPIKQNIIDLVVTNSVLEHIFDFNKVIAETHRILKKNGIFYICIPQVCSRHHQIDYYRWTLPGIEKILETHKFEIIESGMSRGPIHFLIDYIYKIIDASFKNKFLKIIFNNLWRFVSLPFYLIKEKNNNAFQALAHTVYVIAKKK